METNQMPIRSALRSRAFNILLSVVFVPCLSQFSLAQTPPHDEEAKNILKVSEVEQIEFVRLVLNQHFPEKEGDRFSFLLINRSELVIPLLESSVENELRRSPRSERFIDLASAMISYAGDEQALRAINQLITIDEKRFVPLVGRTLNSAANWRNPFGVAYLGVDIGGEVMAQQIGLWADAALSSPRVQRLWAEAIIERYGRVPGEFEWSKDPLAIRLKTSRHEQLRENVIGFATDAIAKRDSHQ